MRESRHNNSESEKERKKQIITVNTWPELIPGLSLTKSWEWLPLSFPGRPIDGSVWGSSPFQFNFLFTNYVFCVSGLQWVSSKKVLYIIKIKKNDEILAPQKAKKHFRLFSKERTLKKIPDLEKKVERSWQSFSIYISNSYSRIFSTEELSKNYDFMRFRGFSQRKNMEYRNMELIIKLLWYDVDDDDNCDDNNYDHSNNSKIIRIMISMVIITIILIMIRIIIVIVMILLIMIIMTIIKS